MPRWSSYGIERDVDTCLNVPQPHVPLVDGVLEQPRDESAQDLQTE